MKQDNLEKFIADQRSEFDSESPPAMVWMNMEKELNVQKEIKKPTVPTYLKPEKIKVAGNVDGVSCDGGHPSLGHPKVYYSFDGKRTIECGYCDRVFSK